MVGQAVKQDRACYRISEPMRLLCPYSVGGLPFWGYFDFPVRAAGLLFDQGLELEPVPSPPAVVRCLPGTRQLERGFQAALRTAVLADA